METLLSLLWIIIWSAGIISVAGGAAWVASKALNWLGRKRKMATPK